MSTTLYDSGVSTVPADIYCADCGADTRPGNQDYVKLGMIAFRAILCEPCWRARKIAVRAANAAPIATNTISSAKITTPKAKPAECKHGVPRPKTCQKCEVARRVGADVFECDCGVVVPIEESLRVMRKSTGKIERMCTPCSKDGSCGGDRHSIVTKNHKDWDPAYFSFAPLPEEFRSSYCTRCHMQLYWDGRRWARMDWEALATAWENA